MSYQENHETRQYETEYTKQLKKDLTDSYGVTTREADQFLRMVGKRLNVLNDLGCGRELSDTTRRNLQDASESMAQALALLEEAIGSNTSDIESEEVERLGRELTKIIHESMLAKEELYELLSEFFRKTGQNERLEVVKTVLDKQDS